MRRPLSLRRILALLAILLDRYSSAWQMSKGKAQLNEVQRKKVAAVDLSNVDCLDSGVKQGGWMTAIKLQSKRPNVTAKLKTIAEELPVPIGSFGGQTPLHLSKAIDAVQQGVPVIGGSKSEFAHETPTYSIKVNAAYMLKHFGMPDEARTLFPFEVSNLRGGHSLQDAQLVRYGDLRFLFSIEGELRYLAMVKQVEF